MRKLTENSVPRDPSFAEQSVGLLMRVGCALLGGCLVGCQSVAPIHVWHPPRVDSAAGKTVAVAPLTGDPEIARPLHAAMLRERPDDSGRSIVAIDASRLQDHSEIRLVSAEEGESSDIALVNLAQRAGVDYLLIGDVMPGSGRRQASRAGMGNEPLPGDDRYSDITGRSGLEDRLVDGDRNGVRVPGGPLFLSPLDPIEEIVTPLMRHHDDWLRVSWKLIDVKRGVPLSGQPVVTWREPGATESATITAAARSAWELLSPHVISDQAQLTSPRLALGATAIRRGNRVAASGDWQQAERVWQAVLDRHPTNHAAMHNLAVAAVARQDFSAAQTHISAALGRHSSPLYRATAVWIEQRQRDYHLAFDLPDPPTGWAATRR